MRNMHTVRICRCYIPVGHYLFLVRLRSTYKVRFCHHRRRCRRLRQEEINPIGMYDSSNESTQRTDYGSVKRFYVLSKTIWQNSVFCGVGTELEPKVKYLKKFSSDFNKQGLK